MWISMDDAERFRRRDMNRRSARIAERCAIVEKTTILHRRCTCEKMTEIRVAAPHRHTTNRTAHAHLAPGPGLGVASDSRRDSQSSARSRSHPHLKTLGGRTHTYRHGKPHATPGKPSPEPSHATAAHTPIRVSTDHMHPMACNWGGNWWQSSGTGLELPVPQTPKVHPHRRPHTCQLPAASAQNAKEDEGAQNKILPVRRPPVPPSTAPPPQSCAKAAVFWRSSMSSCCSFFLSAAPAPSVIASAVSALVE